MDKLQTIEAIVNARKAHENQMRKIEALLKGKEVENPTAVLKTECEFGKWLYDENNHLKEILGDLFYSNLETLHGRWHIEYKRLFDIFFKNKKKKSFLSNFFSSSADDKELDKAKLYYFELEATTNELLKAIASSQRRVEALKESKFY